MGRGDRDGIRGELGEGGWGRRIGARGIGLVRGVDGILEGEERVGELVEGFADAIRGGETEEDVGTTVVGGGWQERGRSRECRVSPTTCGVTASRGRPRVARAGGWDGRRSKRGRRGMRPCHAEREGSGVQERRVLRLSSD